MPAWDYKCSQGHITEHFLKKFVGGVACGFEGCMDKAQYHPTFYYNSPTAQRFTPVVIHRDAKGNIRYPAHANAPVPKGFQRVELTDLHQIRKLEHEVNTRDNVQAQEFQNTRQKFLDGQLAENRRVMSTLVQKFSSRGRAFYEKMKEVSMQKQAASRKSATPAFYLEAFSNDSSNRDAYRDLGNDWGRSGERK